MGPTPPQKRKVMKLTSHTTAMHLMVQFPSDGVIPRERFGPIPQLFVGAATEQRAEQLMAHGQVMENLEHLYQHGDRYGEQHNRLQRVHHLE